MPTLQVRNVPTEVHRALKAKAAVEGSSLSDFVLAELEKVAMRPTPREFLELLRTREPVHPVPSAADVVRELRERE
jgi:plasmid stability protein